MTKKEKEIYDFAKRYNLSPFDITIFYYISGTFPNTKIENVVNVVNHLRQDEIELNKNI